MKKILLLTLTFLNLLGFSQNLDRVVFEYDNAGNQIVRRFCLNCFESKNTNTNIKNLADLKEEDLLKFSPGDNISYYPNPVKEELYLKWELIKEVKVSRIDVYSLSSQLIRSYTNLLNENNKTIPFQEYPTGTYSILLTFTNGEQKPITIIKK